MKPTATYFFKSISLSRPSSIPASSAGVLSFKPYGDAQKTLRKFCQKMSNLQQLSISFKKSSADSEFLNPLVVLYLCSMRSAARGKANAAEACGRGCGEAFSFRCWDAERVGLSFPRPVTLRLTAKGTKNAKLGSNFTTNSIRTRTNSELNIFNCSARPIGKRCSLCITEKRTADKRRFKHHFCGFPEIQYF